MDLGAVGTGNRVMRVWRFLRAGADPCSLRSRISALSRLIALDVYNARLSAPLRNSGILQVRRLHHPSWACWSMSGS